MDATTYTESVILEAWRNRERAWLWVIESPDEFQGEIIDGVHWIQGFASDVDAMLHSCLPYAEPRKWLVRDLEGRLRNMNRKNQPSWPVHGIILNTTRERLPL